MARQARGAGAAWIVASSVASSVAWRAAWVAARVVAGTACGVAWGIAAAHAASPATTQVADAAATAPDPVARRADALADLGGEHPQPALQALDGLAPEAVDAAGERAVLVARGVVLARAGRAEGADAVVQALQRRGGTLDLAAAELVRATRAETQGDAERALEHAQAAADGYARGCAARPTCEPGPRWRTLMLLHGRALAQGRRVMAREHADRALDLARAHHDLERQAWAHSLIAAASAELGDHGMARRQFAQAQDLAQRHGGDDIAARLKLSEARLAAVRGQGTAAIYEQALVHARRADAPRLQALLLGNLADARLRQGRAREALAAVEQALPVVRAYGDRRTERMLVHNAGLARIALGRVAQGRRDLEQALTLWSRPGSEDEQAQALREFGQALAAAGDVDGALALYHRERKVSAQLMAANREAALRELRQHDDREAKQRDIRLLERDNALKAVQLDNRALMARLWALVAAIVALSLAVAGLLYRRGRETQRRLEHSHALLRVQSERDALTGLANRRHFQETMRARGIDADFEGALLLVDVDHFKRINDERGHVFGDEVLVEVAQRIAAAVRDDDLVVRWGGEEFLVVAAADAAQALAARLLQALGAAPVSLAAGSIAVTASIGWAHFPLPPHRPRLTWSQAVHLVDMALYAAKAQGRNRAVGIVSAAAQAEALPTEEADFERACREGRVQLQVMRGPGGAPGGGA